MFALFDRKNTDQRAGMQRLIRLGTLLRLPMAGVATPSHPKGTPYLHCTSPTGVTCRKTNLWRIKSRSCRAGSKDVPLFHGFIHVTHVSHVPAPGCKAFKCGVGATSVICDVAKCSKWSRLSARQRRRHLWGITGWVPFFLWNGSRARR